MSRENRIQKFRGGFTVQPDGTPSTREYSAYMEQAEKLYALAIRIVDQIVALEKDMQQIDNTEIQDDNTKSRYTLAELKESFQYYVYLFHDPDFTNGDKRKIHDTINELAQRIRQVEIDFDIPEIQEQMIELHLQLATFQREINQYIEKDIQAEHQLRTLRSSDTN